MKKNVLLYCFIVFILLQCVTTTDHTTRDKKPQDSLLIEQLYPLYLGMPMTEFDAVKKDKAQPINQDSIMDFRIEKKEIYVDEIVESVIYYFDAENNNTLYEFIIYFHKDFDLKNYVRDRYGITKAYDQKSFDSGEDFTILIWYFKNTLVIAGKIAGTEWEEGLALPIEQKQGRPKT